MKRFTLTAVASALVLSLAPASALASHHHKSKRHHSRVHHVRARHLRFGDLIGSSATTTTTTPTTTPSDTAGTVASFAPASGTTPASLTIKLNDGTLVTAAFTDATQLECQMAEPADSEATEPMENDATEPSQAMTADGGNDSGGDSHGGNGGVENGGNGNSGGDGGGGGDNGDQAGDEQGGQSPSCTTANLTPGAVISGAEIRISSAGKAWDKVELNV